MSDKFKKIIVKEYKDDVHFGTLSIDCWDTGIYSYNKALGGGIAAGRTHLLVGKESTGKSTISSKLAGRVSSTSYKTGKWCEPDSEAGCKVLYVDAEGTLDRDWCACHDYYPESGGNLVLSTNTGNQAIDIINAAIQSKEFSLIILDSLEALIPFKDLEKSSEDFVMGTKAKMNNDAFRRWTVAMINASRGTDAWWQRPTLVVINQLRDTISAMPAPPTIPGGIGQKQAATTITQMNSPTYSDDGKLGSKGLFKGVLKKNKMATPRIGFEFEMALRDLEDMHTGQVNNVRSIIQDIRRYGIWQDEGKEGWSLFGKKEKIQTDFAARMMAEPDYELEVMQQVIQHLRK